MARPYDIMVAGHLCLDLFPTIPDTGAARFDELIQPGKLVNVDSLTMGPGGVVSNTGVAMLALGDNVRFCAAVGDDELGRLTRDILAENGNVEGITTLQGVPSSYSIVIAPPGLDRFIFHNPETNDLFGPENLDPGQIAECRLFHFGYPPLMRRMYVDNGRELRDVFEMAKQAGATTSCDLALPDPDSESGQIDWKVLLANVLPVVDLFVPSVEEALYVLDPQKFKARKEESGNSDLIQVLTPADHRELADAILGMGAKIAVLKSGSRGFYLKTDSSERFDEMGAARPGDPDNWSQRELWAPAFATDNFCNAAGAGDSAIGGFLSAFLRGKTIEESVRLATCCGWQNVQVPDASSGIRTFEESETLLAGGLATLPLDPQSDGWQWSDSHQVWAAPGDPLNVKTR